MFAGGAFFLWGVIPLYWELLRTVPAAEIAAHRVFWCAVTIGVFLAWRDRLAATRLVFRDTRMLRTLALTSILIATNWGIFIYCVVSDQLVEASLGYFINPIVSVALAVGFLGESLSPCRMAALALASLAVLYQTLALGSFPVFALILAFSFGFYGFFKKQAPVSAMDGLLVETLLLAPAALLYVGAYLGGGAANGASAPIWALLIASGAVTAAPLLLFNLGARRIRLSTLGFLQYLGPSLTLLIAVLILGEPFTDDHAITFGLIWASLALIGLEGVRLARTSVSVSR
ncbi:MAG: EamA family transporter RarD [Alphaproteobacteria bacterium]|nr:EamA family transporter RarD [Alphaproteobacteria bacterium]